MHLSILRLHTTDIKRAAAALAAALVLSVAAAGSCPVPSYAAESVYQSSANTQLISDAVAGSTFAILINGSTGQVVAQKTVMPTCSRHP